MTEQALTARLAEIRKAWEVFGEGSATPVLADALEAVLALHQPTEGIRPIGCTSCLDAYGEHEEWPCGEYRAISAELLGEGKHRWLTRAQT